MTAASTIPATDRTPAPPTERSAWRWRTLVTTGLLGGAVAVYLCLVGIVPIFASRPLIVGVASLGQATVLGTLAMTGYFAARPLLGGPPMRAIAKAAVGSMVTGALLAALVLVGSVVDVRAVFINASPDLYTLLTAGLGISGFWVPIALGAVMGTLAGIAARLPAVVRIPFVVGVASLLFFGLFAGLLRTPLLVTPLVNVARFLFAPDGLTVAGAVITFVATVVIVALVRQTHPRQRVNALPAAQRRVVLAPMVILLAIIVLAFPIAFGPFFAQVIAIVALYTLLGLGLNITLGLAGLLDLGFVAFFAVGAYTVGLLTSTAEFGIAGLSFWAAVPFAVVLAMLFGAFFGLPILGIRGDYLAIATLGFGEIVRILAGSDLLKAWLGGPRGIINIPKPIDLPPTHPLAGSVQIYYIALIGAAVVAFVAWRLQGSRLGRSWMAIREDEDVAEGMGVNLVQTKLLAYMLGAGFAGLAGAISAGLVGSVFASSIQLFLSINVAAIVIVGGLGSIPGVVLGALFLIGLPELFREFSDYRFLFYGFALIAMMLFRPEGLLPSKITRREVHTVDELVAMDESELVDKRELIELDEVHSTKPRRAGGPR